MEHIILRKYPLVRDPLRYCFDGVAFLCVSVVSGLGCFSFPG